MISEKLQLILPSLPESIHKIEKFVEDICDEFNINNTYFGNILVAVTEAFENAAKHGNGNDPARNVQLVFSSGPEGLSFVIKDEGKGFDLNTIPDPTDLNIDADQIKGRGIFLIRNLADEVNFTDNGSRVELVFKISSINHELAVERMNLLKKYSGIKEASSHSQQDSNN